MLRTEIFNALMHTDEVVIENIYRIKKMQKHSHTSWKNWKG
jgi:hypothetical protein